MLSNFLNNYPLEESVLQLPPAPCTRELVIIYLLRSIILLFIIAATKRITSTSGITNAGSITTAFCIE